MSGRIDWTFGRTGQTAGAVRYEAQLALPNVYLRLYFTVSDPIRGESHSVKQEIRLTTTRPRFGGVRWWFICPQSGARVGRPSPSAWLNRVRSDGGRMVSDMHVNRKTCIPRRAPREQASCKVGRPCKSLLAARETKGDAMEHLYTNTATDAAFEGISRRRWTVTAARLSRKMA